MTSPKEPTQKRKKTTPVKLSIFEAGLFRQYLSVLLIFVLFLSQTIQVSWFDKALADAKDYRDIVSVIVDEDSYNQLRPKIRRYAEDIQSELKTTRVSIIVTPKNIRPEIVAAHNEKLYYE